jgi:excisionase family DNA binding protein
MQAIRVDLSQPLLNADDVAALLSVPRSSVYEYARRLCDPLPSVSIGRHRRFIREDIEEWLALRRDHASLTSRAAARLPEPALRRLSSPASGSAPKGRIAVTVVS